MISPRSDDLPVMWEWPHAFQRFEWESQNTLLVGWNNLKQNNPEKQTLLVKIKKCFHVVLLFSWRF